MRVIRVVCDAVHLSHVCLIGDGSHVHLNVPLSRHVRLRHRVRLVDVRAAVGDDNRDVMCATPVATARREHFVVGPVDRLLRVRLGARLAEAQRVQDLLLALVIVEVELDLRRVRVADESDPNAAVLEGQTVDDLIDEAHADLVDRVDAAGQVQDEGHVHLFRATCKPKKTRLEMLVRVCVSLH